MEKRLKRYSELAKSGKPIKTEVYKVVKLPDGTYKSILIKKD